MPSLNKVLLIGRLTKDPELRYTSSGIASCSFTIAVDRPFKDQATGERKTDFFRCKAWKQKAEFVSNYIGKGRLVAVDGRIELNEYTGDDGVKKYYTDIIANDVELLDQARDENAPPQQEPGTAPRAAAAPRPAPQPRQGTVGAPRPATAPRPAPAAPAGRDAFNDDFDDSDPFADS